MNKKIMSVLIIVLLFFLSVSFSSAQDINNTQTNNIEVNSTSTDNMVLGNPLNQNEKTFDDLKTIIDNSEDNTVINLDSDYKYNGTSDFDGITITKNNLTINGNGHTLNANHANNTVRIFTITGSNITLKNLIFANGYSGNLTNGGSIINTGLKLSIINSTFINSTSTRWGGAILNNGKNLNVVNSNFLNCGSFKEGGAIASISANFTVINSTFINNYVNSSSGGGAILNMGSNAHIINSRFINNTAKRSFGGAIRSTGIDLYIINSTFINNTAEKSFGGAVHNNEGNCYIINSKFVNNTAYRGGGAIYNANVKLSVVNSIFENNSVINKSALGSGGGAIYNYDGINCSIVDSTFKSNSAYDEGGAIYNMGIGFFLEDVNLFIKNSTFNNNIAQHTGGAIYNEGINLSVLCSNFDTNIAQLGGAVYDNGTNSSILESSFVNNFATSGESIYAKSSININENWWGSNNPNWAKLINNTNIPDNYAILNLTAEFDNKNFGTINTNLYKNGTTEIIKIYPRNLKLTIRDDTISGKIINGSFQTDYQFPKGNYNISATVDNQILNFTIFAKRITYLEANDLIMIYHDGSKFIAKLIDIDKKAIANATIQFTINNKTYNKITDAKGFAYLTINLDSGYYPIYAEFKGNETYNASSANKTIIVNPTIIANNLVKTYGDRAKFVANFTDSNKTALANTKIKFNINGVLCNKTTDKTGSAELNINLRPGQYVLTAYNPITNEQKAFNITVNSLIESNDLTKYYKNESQFIVKIYGKDGKIAQNKTVQFNINGVLYTKTTNTTGHAKLNINLKPGNYTITTTVDGLDVGNHITVLPTLLTNDLTMNYLDNSTFMATTLDNHGNPLDNQTVKFNIHGVIYNKTTNGDGIASLNIKLIPGKYIITSYWKDYEIENTIKING